MSVLAQICKPATKLIGAQRYSLKFVIISLIFLIPLLLTQVLLYVELTESIDFTRKEQMGAEQITRSWRFASDLAHLHAQLSVNPQSDRIAQLEQAAIKSLQQAVAMSSQMEASEGLRGSRAALIEAQDSLTSRDTEQLNQLKPLLITFQKSVANDTNDLTTT